MDIKNMKKLVIGNLTARLPIIQGGMGVGVSMAGLSSAVANQGGIGVISVAGIGMFEPDFARNFVEANITALKKEIQKARELTKGIIGVNIMSALSNFADMVTTAIESKIDIIFAGAGLPLDLPKYLTPGSRTKLVPIVSSGRAIKLIAKKWHDKFGYVPDAVVVEGPKAGGHLGFKAEQIDDPEYSLEKIVPDVINEVKAIEEETGKTIPVIAAGGIYTGADIRKFIKMGAAGVQMGTRFVTTDECDASDNFKKAYLACKESDISIIKSPVGMPGRAINNEFLDQVKAGAKKPYACPYHCIVSCDVKNSPYCIARALMNAQRGRLDEGFAFAGANAYREKEIIPVSRLIRSLEAEYGDAVKAEAPAANRQEPREPQN